MPAPDQPNQKPTIRHWCDRCGGRLWLKTKRDKNGVFTAVVECEVCRQDAEACE